MCCRSMTRENSAWRHGLAMALQCSRCCANLMLVLLIVGVMNLPAMAIIGAAIAIERISPRGLAAARIVGVAVAMTGVVMLALAQ